MSLIKIVMLLAVFSLLAPFLRTSVASDVTETIYIKDDGSVYPSYAPILRNGNVYTLTGNISVYADGIVIQRSNIMLDGNNCALSRIDPNGGGFTAGINLSEITNVKIMNMKVEGFYEGVSFHMASNNSVSCLTMTNNTMGINLYKSLNNSIIWNNFALNDFGVYVLYSNMNRVSENNIVRSSYYGIHLRMSSNNSVLRNYLTENGFCGVDLYKAVDNKLNENVIVNNQIGFYVMTTWNNSIFHNAVAGNKWNVLFAYGHVSRNKWDCDYPEGGNYWSNYTGVDSDHDGIGDSLFELNSNNTDHYPLMGMFYSFNTSRGWYVNVVSNSTVESLEYFEYNSTIKMYVSNMTVNQAFGFCRVCIPHTLMNVNNVSVIIDDRLTNVLYFNNTIYYNGTHKWIYFAYEYSTHEIVIVPEFPLSLILPLCMMVTLLAAIIYKTKLRI